MGNWYKSCLTAKGWVPNTWWRTKDIFYDIYSPLAQSVEWILRGFENSTYLNRKIAFSWWKHNVHFFHLNTASLHYLLYCETTLSSLVLLCRDSVNPEKMGWIRDKIDCQKVYLMFLCRFCLGINTDLRKVGWTCPPKSTLWRHPCMREVIHKFMRQFGWHCRFLLLQTCNYGRTGGDRSWEKG